MEDITTTGTFDKYKPRNLMDLLRMDGYKDPVWQTYLHYFAPTLVPYQYANCYNKWTQPSFYGHPSRLTQILIMKMIVGTRYPFWLSGKRLKNRLGTALTFDLENKWSWNYALSRAQKLITRGIAHDRLLHSAEALGDIPYLPTLSGGKGDHLHIFPKDTFKMFECDFIHAVVMHELEKGGAEVIPRQGKHFCRMPFGPGSGIITNLDHWRKLKAEDKTVLTDNQLWPIEIINDGILITDPAENLHALYKFIQEHKSDAPTIAQIEDKLMTAWMPNTRYSIPKGPLPPFPAPPSYSDAQIWEEGAGACESSNEASMVGVRHCLRQDMDYDDAKETVWEWLVTTGSEFDQVQSGVAYQKLDNIISNCEIGKRIPPPTLVPGPGGSFVPIPLPKNPDLLSAAEISAIEQRVHPDDLPAALAVAKFIRQVQRDNGLFPQSPVAIHSKKHWRKFPGCNADYKAVQQRLVECGLIKIFKKHSAGRKSTTFTLAIPPH